VTSLFDTVGSLLDSRAFGLLPDFLQSGARKLYNSIRSLWDSIRDFWTDLWKRLTSFIQELLASIESFVRQVVSYAIDGVIATVKTLKEVYDFVHLLVTDPEAVVRPLIDHLAGKIQTEAPPKAEEVAHQKMAEALASRQSAAPSVTKIQRSPAEAETRTTTSRDEVNDALVRALRDQWALLDFRKMLWDTFVNMFWPPATIRAIGHEFYELWTKDWAAAVDSLFLPRNVFDDFWGFLHDVWSNILILLDFPLALWRRLNNILTVLMGYVTIILVIVGAVGGAIVGNVPGALAGAWAGLQLAWAIGEALFLSFLLAEGTSALKAFLDLFTALQTQEQKKRDYLQIAASTIGIGIAIVIALLFGLLGRIASEVVALIKAKGKVPSLPPARQTVRVPGLVEAIDPAVAPKGYTFTDTISKGATEIEIKTSVTAPDGTSGTMSRGLNPTTGEFVFHYAFLDRIPKDLRMVPTTPEMLPGKGTPLETYMTLRQLKLLQNEAGIASGPRGFFGTQPRKVVMSTIINKRTIAELAALERGGALINDAVISTHSVQYANNTIVQGGGRIAKAEVTGGYRTAASNELSPAELTQYKIPADYELLTGFEIELDIVPADSPVPAAQKGKTPLIPPPPVKKDED